MVLTVIVELNHPDSGGVIRIRQQPLVDLERRWPRLAARGEVIPPMKPEVSERALWSGTLTSRFSTRPSCYAPVSVMAHCMHIGGLYRCWCAGRVRYFSDSTV